MPYSNTTKTKTLNWTESRRLSAEILDVIPGGVNSPFRSFHEVGGHTLFFEKGAGPYIFDVDNNKYIDYVGAWGPAILGHGDREVAEAIRSTLDKGPLFGAPHRLELEMASLMADMVPAIEMVRFVNSGTEAVMSAIRLARGFTGKEKIITFKGCYHGHSDPTLATIKSSHSDGIPKSTGKNTLEADFNDLASVESCLEKYNGEVACVILEPVTGSMGVIEPEIDFLAGLRSLCTKYDVLLIFDEVLTGFRVSQGGAQCLYDIEPDLSCWGKLIGGGMPIGAFGGKKAIMQKLMPLGKVYQAGTFSGNPVSMAGGVAILKKLNNKAIYEELEKQTARMFTGLQKHIDKEGYPVQLQRVGSMFSILFTKERVYNFKTSKKINERQFAKFFHASLQRGIYFPPTAQDASCVSFAHKEKEIDETIDALNQSLDITFAK